MFYSGTLSGSIATSNGDSSIPYFDDIVNTTIAIGVNPPTDLSPCFFE